MARKKEPSTAVALPAQTGIVDWQAALQQSAQRAVQSAQDVATGTAPRITFDKAGVNFNKDSVGRSLKVVVLAAQFYRQLYDRQFDENDPTGPKCYSFDGHAPHAKSHAPQSKQCKDCQWDKFDSNPNGRGGKGCAEVGRFVAIHADELKKKPADLIKVEPAIAGVSVLNRKVLAKYIASGVMLPSVVTELTSNAPKKGGNVGYDLELEAVAPVKLDSTLGPVIAQLVVGAEKKLAEPLPEYKEAEKSAKRKKFSSK